MKFEDMGLREQILAALSKMEYKNPTEVQEKVIPLIIKGRNVLARSKTGTGKTAAFGIGIVERLLKGTAKKALVLAPTRELTVQVSKELKKIAENCPLKLVAVYGGHSINPQIQALRKGVDILVATPGRLLDHAERGTVDLSQFDVVVLDEADRMLDMGFKDEMDRVMARIPKERTVLLLSATLEPAIMAAASRYMSEPEVVEVGEKEKPHEIREEFVEATRNEKFSRLKDELRKHADGKAIVFTATKIFANRLADRLIRHGFKADRLQGDMSQAARERVLKKFREGSIKVLVATDVASRGLHIEDVGLIVNYDRANDDDTHLHRVGRTGRMGTEGKAITFAERKETRHERFSEDHPDFAWMKNGAGSYRSRETSYSRRPGRKPRRDDRKGSRNRSRPHGRRPRDSRRKPRR
jgi:ATP-dependent RNA helicase DeaD